MRKDAGPAKPGAPTKPVPTMTSAEISAAAVAAAVAATAAARGKGAVGSGDLPRLLTGYTWAVPASDDTDGSAATAAAPERVLVASGAVLTPPKLVQTVLGQLLELHCNLGKDDSMEVGPITRGKVGKHRCVCTFYPPACGFSLNGVGVGMGLGWGWGWGWVVRSPSTPRFVGSP